MAPDIIRDNKVEKYLFMRRALISFIGVLLLLGVLITNIYYLQVTNHQKYTTRSNENRIKLLPVPPTRGLIYDREGTLLAENLTYFGLYVVPDKTSHLNNLFEELKPIIGLSNEDIDDFNKERSRNTRYTPILLKGNLSNEQVARISVDLYKYPSLEILPYFKRHYLYGKDLAHILGYVGKINDKDVNKLKDMGELADYAGTHDIGKSGIERYYENILHGTVGHEEVEVNNRGKVVRTLSKEKAIAGKNIQLTIDLPLQRYINTLMQGYNGAAVVLDPHDGSVLAMVSTPSYDNNLFVGGISNKDYNELLNNPNRPLYNRASYSAYPPASTVKPFISVAALQEKVITPTSTIFDPGYWVLPGTKRRYRDWLRRGHGTVDLNKAIEESADTYFYQVAYDMGIDRLSSWMNKFGFGKATGIDLGESTTGIMPTREWKEKRFKQPWYQGDTIPVGIGQGYWTASPLQVAKALTILVNDGVAYTPHLLKETQGKQIEPYQDPKILPDIKVSDMSYWKDAQQGMYNVVNGKTGTARRAFEGTPYKVAGKSGTAQVFSLKKDEVYNSSKLSKDLHDHAWFIAYAPYKNPQLVVAVILENAGGGSGYAAPVVRKIMDFYLLQQNHLDDLQQNKQ